MSFNKMVINYDEQNVLTLRSYPVNNLMLNSIDTFSIVKSGTKLRGVMGSQLLLVICGYKECAHELLIIKQL